MVEGGANAAATAEIAEQILPIWQKRWKESLPGLILVHERLHSCLVDHLRLRILDHEPVLIRPGQSQSLADSMHAALDGGATLIAGGRKSGPLDWQPTLFVNVSMTSALLQAGAATGPVLAVLRTAACNPTSAVLGHLTDQSLEVHYPASDGA